jgi:hypothetical protein
MLRYGIFAIIFRTDIGYRSVNAFGRQAHCFDLVTPLPLSRIKLSMATPRKCDQVIWIPAVAVSFAKMANV